MSDPTREQVQRAYDLFKTGRRTEALHVLQQVILMDDKNVNAWWLMAHITQTPADQRVALDHVLRLNPNHAKAQKMLKQLVEQYPELAEKPSILVAGPAVVKPRPAKPRADHPAPVVRRDSGRRKRFLLMVAVAVLVVVVVAAVVLQVAGGL